MRERLCVSPSRAVFNLYQARQRTNPLFKNLFFLSVRNSMWGRCVLQPPAPGCKTQAKLKPAIKLARSPPTKADAKRGFCPQKPSGAREMWERRQARCLKNHCSFKIVSNFVAETEPIISGAYFCDEFVRISPFK